MREERFEKVVEWKEGKEMYFCISLFILSLLNLFAFTPLAEKGVLSSVAVLINFIIAILSLIGIMCILIEIERKVYWRKIR